MPGTAEALKFRDGKMITTLKCTDAEKFPRLQAVRVLEILTARVLETSDKKTSVSVTDVP